MDVGSHKNPAPNNWCSPKLQQFQFPSDKSTDIQRAFDDQQAIGWHNALREYLAKSWAKLAAINRFNPETMNIQEGRGRIRNIIQDIYELTTAIWKGRNAILHDMDNKAQFYKQNIESQEIIHGNRQILPAGDQYLCNQDLNELLKVVHPQGDDGLHVHVGFEHET
jgi:hypothetical protein